MATKAKKLAAWNALDHEWGPCLNVSGDTTTGYRKLAIYNYLEEDFGIPAALSYPIADLQDLSEAFGSAQIKLYFDGALVPAITRDLDISVNSQQLSARKSNAIGKDIQVEVTFDSFVGMFKFANATHAVEIDIEPHNRHRRSQ